MNISLQFKQYSVERRSVRKTLSRMLNIHNFIFFQYYIGEKKTIFLAHNYTSSNVTVNRKDYNLLGFNV